MCLPIFVIFHAHFCLLLLLLVLAPTVGTTSKNLFRIIIICLNIIVNHAWRSKLLQATHVILYNHAKERNYMHMLTNYKKDLQISRNLLVCLLCWRYQIKIMSCTHTFDRIFMAPIIIITWQTLPRKTNKLLDWLYCNEWLSYVEQAIRMWVYLSRNPHILTQQSPSLAIHPILVYTS